MIGIKDINIWSIGLLALLPFIYVMFEDFPKLQGIFVGAILMRKLSDVQKYGLKALFMVPNQTIVAQVYDLITEGNLEQLKKLTKNIPHEQIVKMK